MRRAAPSIAAAVLAVSLLPTLCSAGWRSADRWRPEDDVVVDEPHRQDGPQHEYDHWDGDQWNSGAERGRPARTYRQHRRDADRVPNTQPYWGTMRPYWNGPEPPGVIHRQPRTAPLKVRK